MMLMWIASPPLNAQNVTTPPGIIYFVAINIANLQSSPTPTPFEQVIKLDSSVFASHEAANLQNIEFFNADGSIIPSWLESGTTSASITTIYWLNIANGVPASSSVTVYMGFATVAANLLNSLTTGEAPQVSPSYAQYDDGATVFPILYQNFAGTATPSGWINIGTTINNGVSISNGQCIIGTSATYGSDPTQIFDAIGNMLPGQVGQVGAGYIRGTDSIYNSGGAYQAAIGTTITNNAYSADFVAGSGGFGSGYTYADTTVTTDNALHVYTIYYSESFATAWVDYAHQTSVTLRGSATMYPVGMTGDNSGSATTGPYYVMRIRSYPPSGIMPTASINGQPTSTTSNTSSPLLIEILTTLIVIAAVTAGILVWRTRRGKGSRKPSTMTEASELKAEIQRPEVAEKLQSLQKLRDEGLITKEDFDQQRKKLTG